MKIKTIMNEKIFWPVRPVTIFWILLVIAGVTITAISFTGNHESNNDEAINHLNDSTSKSELMESVYDRIFQLRLEHPNIVMAQCILESGEFTSDIFVNGNNCLGMKVPGQRPTFAVGVYRSHARFRSWHDCIADYALWQSAYGRGLSDDAYLALLDRIYAEDGSYAAKLKSIIRKYEL